MKGIFKFHSLNKKIILSIFIVIALCVVVSAFIVNLVVEYQMTRKYEVEKEAAIESLSSSLAPMLDLYNYKQLEQTIRASLIYENIAFIAVFNDSGNLVKSATEQNTASEDLDITKHDITSGGKTIGSFEIGFSKKHIDEQIQRTTLALMLGLVGFLILVGLALFTFMSRSVIQPIEAFTRTVGEINPENLSVRMKVQTEDEIGILAMSFNRMAEDLEKSHGALQKARDELEHKVEVRTKGERRRAEQLRSINEVGRRISSILSLDELLPYVVSSLQEAFDYYNVNVFLLDPDSDGLVLKAGAGGYKGTVPIGFLIRLTEGIVGSVAQTGEPLMTCDVSKEPKYLFAQELPDTRSELAVPIKIGTEILGVLDVQSIELDAFDEIDLFTVQTLGDQVAIAVENARLYQETREMAVLEERNRMAREIHDTLAQGFTGIVLQLEAAEQALGEDVTNAQFHLDRARRLARESLAEARRSVWALRPRTLEQLSLTKTLRQEVRKFIQESGVKANFNTSGKRRVLLPDVENALLRICQESLTNVKKHAQASHVEVNLAFEEKAVSLKIQDNGIGFNHKILTKNRFGLISMRERARLLEGLIEIRGEKGQGTYLEVTIPINRETV
ncbi:histidine kinase [Chloroflexota bacterium]